jgi:hypothetical protein
MGFSSLDFGILRSRVYHEGSLYFHGRGHWGDALDEDAMRRRGCPCLGINGRARFLCGLFGAVILRMHWLDPAFPERRAAYRCVLFLPASYSLLRWISSWELKLVRTTAINNERVIQATRFSIVSHPISIFFHAHFCLESFFITLEKNIDDNLHVT